MVNEYDFLDFVAPKALSKDELNECLIKSYSGDKEARDKVIKHNIRLVLNVVNKRFSNTNFDKKDLFSVGLYGLVKSVDTFNPNKNNAFSSYACICISNEILMLIRENKKRMNDESLDDIISVDKEGNDLTYKDIIATDEDVAEKAVNKEMLNLIINNIENLSYLEKKIIMLRYGLVDGRMWRQHEIANKVKISRSYVSRLEQQAIKKLKEMVNKNNLNSRNLINGVDNKNLGFPLLNEDNKLETVQNFHNKNVIQDCKKTESITSKGKNLENIVNDIKQNNSEIKVEVENRQQVNRQININYNTDDCLTIFKFLKQININSILEKLNTKELIIFYLRFGFIDGTCFSIESIAKFLEISELEVIAIIKNILLIYKEQINILMEQLIDVTINKDNILVKD